MWLLKLCSEEAHANLVEMLQTRRVGPLAEKPIKPISQMSYWEAAIGDSGLDQQESDLINPQDPKK